MSKKERTLTALRATITKCSEDIKQLQEKGGFPADYSLGFTNGLIFVWQRLTGDLSVKFFDHKTQIGNLPMPVVFLHEAEEQALDAAEYEAKLKNVIDGASNAVKTWNEEHKEEAAMSRAMVLLAEFLDDLKDFEKKTTPPAGDTPGGALEGAEKCQE